ncbi:MAG TPA: hypothetical protein VMD59_05835 [Acidimicrobiales bacterium]|nr:hypothetical protein [Acidimicrobiales bacterium]
MTTAPATSSPASSVPATTLPPAASSSEIVLLPAEEHAGSWTTSRFTVGVGIWELAYQYQCTEVREGPAFQVLSASSGSTALGEVLERYPLSGSGIERFQQNVPVDLTLQVEADESCTSSLKAIEQH